MKKILITGNSGYIGSHLSKMLDHSQFEIYGIDRDDPIIPVDHFTKFNINNVDHWPYQDIEFDYLIHLAAEKVVSDSVNTPAIYYETNIFGTLNVLSNIKSKHYLIASTGAAESLTSPYAISKRAMEQVVVEKCTSDYTIFRFYNVVGADDIPPREVNGILYNLIKAKQLGTFNIFGTNFDTPDGSCIRDFIHVYEICQALVNAFDCPTNSIENLGHGENISVLDAINFFKQANDCEFNVVDQGPRPGDEIISTLDNPSKFVEKLYSTKDLFKIND